MIEHDALHTAWRDERVAVVAAVARRLGDLQLAEDAVQEAFAAAAVRWPVDGVPDRPGAWLMTTAWRKALDVLRRERFPTVSDAAAEPAFGVPPSEPDPSRLDVTDDVLGLVLTCCHPSLSVEAQVALTLRHVAGLSAREIAAAFLIPEPTMTKRLVRARGKVRDAGISFEPPGREELPERLGAVHTVVYLIFNEGFLTSGDGPPIRSELCAEAVWLARQVRRLVPDDAETTGLLALLMLQHARSAARQGPAGELLTYDDQDRSRWDHDGIIEAKALLADTGTRPPGPYQVEAAIALLHATAPGGGHPDWSAIADLYRILARLAPSPVVEVNRAVAVGRADGPRAGLAALQPALDDPLLTGYLPMHAAHADLLENASDPGAPEAWRRAAALAVNPAQRSHLLKRAARAAADG